MNEEQSSLFQAALQSVPFHRFLGVKLLEIEPIVVIEMKVAVEVGGMATPLHGGAIASLVDVAGSFAAATQASDYRPTEDGLVTLDLHLQFRAQPRTAGVQASARLIQRLDNLLRVACDVTESGADRCLATAAITYLVLPERLRRTGTALNANVREAVTRRSGTRRDRAFGRGSAGLEGLAHAVADR